MIGIDYSRRFIAAAEKIRTEGEIPCLRADEGALTTESRAVVPREIDRRRVRFEVGDAMDLRTDLGRFDVVLMANLIDRLSEPRRCLARLPALVNKEFTPRDAWLGGFERGGQRISTREGLIAELSAGFSLVAVRDLPLLIREHARKFQWSVAEATIWRRKSLETNARP